MISLAFFLTGIALGFGAAWFLWRSRAQDAQKIAAELKSQFGNLSLEALSKFLVMASSTVQAERELTGKELENNKALIGQQLGNMTIGLEKVTNLVQSLEKDRENKFGELASQLKNTNQQVTALHQATHTLNEALANSRARGQWGQRMAEDVLRLAGFVENINYLKEKMIEGIGSRPDITFLLPKNLKLNMDVKFPFDNYLRFLESGSEADKDRFKSSFFKDVRAKLKEVTSRDYINPRQNTVDYVILFVPNEQIFTFIHEQDPSILDDGLKNHVIFCSPITLFAVLAIIRQAVDNFSLEQTSNDLLILLGNFKAQWDLFLKKMESMGKKIADAQNEYEELVTTRKNKLDKPLNRIDALRLEKGLSSPPQEPLLELAAEEEAP